jgi:cell wall-associated NlpC family hydrolase
MVVNAALAYLGTPYSWGGGSSSGPTTGISAGCTSQCMQFEPWNTVGFDCSGLTLYAWAQAGVSLPHYSAYQYQSGQHISRSNLQPGDLVFFASDTSDWTTIHHVAIYLGSNQLIEAAESGTTVHIRNWRDDGYIGAVRPGT